MEHARKDECFSIDPNMEASWTSSHEEDPPFLLGFPSPFLDEISAVPTLAHKHHPSSSNKPLNTTAPPPNSESKRLKKNSVGKKDRHSKIHTAQGLRDRRMRLSLHIARKFFDLQDLLGFDKASKTIEWLFCKSNKAIKEVAKNFNPPHANQSMSEEMDSFLSECEVGLNNEIEETTNKRENTKITNESRKRVQNSSLARDQARARARKRTRERLMIKELNRSNYLLGVNPTDEIYNLGLGYSGSPSNHNIEELWYTSSPSDPILQESSSPAREHSSTHHLLRELHMANINIDSFDYYSGNIAGASKHDTALINHNPPAGWLNSSNGFIGIQGEWDVDKFINNGIVPSTATLTGDIYDQNPSSFFMSSTTNILHS